MSHVHTLPITTICAIKFLPRWNPEQIAKFQKEDPDLRVLYAAKKSGKERPAYKEFSGESPVCKS